MLYKSRVEYADYCVNHVVGCSHGCKYPCYAFLLKKRCGIVKSYEDWCKPKLVANAIELLKEEIPKYKELINHVHLCFSTDPFMYGQVNVKNMSLRIIKLFNSFDIKCTVLTKGVFPVKLLCDNKYSKTNEYGASIVSLNESFRKQYEPNAAPYAARLKALKDLSAKGFKTWISMEPYPTPNFIEQDIEELLDAVGFVDRIVFGRMNYNSKVTGYVGFREFYNALSAMVVKFCKKRGIECHIKNGTVVSVENKLKCMVA